MKETLDGFYAAYLSGKAAQGFAMLIFRKGKIVGAGTLGDVFDGHYEVASDSMLSVKIKTRSPPNTTLIQGGITGPEGETGDLAFTIPQNFSSQDYIRIETQRGPVNVKLVRLRGVDDSTPTR